ncbi:MAG: hypothetical protein O7B25_12870 [Gammaproteobacteria bacterium]|nr:hypothetical protein [Gammaproteobacteria bacterium]
MLFGAGLAACNGSSTAPNSSSFSDDADPVIQDFAISYVKRPVLLDRDGNLETSEVRSAVEFRPGAELFVRDRASPSAAETSITLDIFADDVDGNPPVYDVKDVSASFDGTKLVFAMRAPADPNLDDDEQPTWNIWIYDNIAGTADRVIDSDIAAEIGEDVAPRFLPDGRIVFSSTRQRQSKAILLDEGKPQFSGLDEDRDEEALTLHVMDEDGGDIHQITFNQSSDLDPTVLSNGRVAFSRWDNVAGNDRISLYAVNPDGSDLQLLYGVHSHDTGPHGETVEFVEAQELPDARLLVLLRPPGGQSRMATIPVIIDTEAYVEHDQPTFANQGLLADAQEFLIPADLSFDDDAPVLQGRYANFAPLFDGTPRLLASWSQCRLIDEISDPFNPVIGPCIDQFLVDPNYVEADPLYGVWIFDQAEFTQLPIVVADEGEMYSEVVVLEPKVNPPVILDKTAGIDLDPDLVGESVGVIHVRSVYDFDGAAIADLGALSDPLVAAAADRPARFVRIVKAVSIPDDDIVDLDGTAFGRSQAQGMREIIGYAHVEPDGSFKMKVPANIAFWVDVLDADGRRIFPRHNNWMQVRPGEELECNGCHTPQSEVPHGRMSAEAPSANAGAVSDGSPFPNTEPGLFADATETMAEVITRINEVPNPNVNLEYDDLWTDADVRSKDASFSYAYADLTTLPPVDLGCVANWTAMCRITIHYEIHIHPLWSVNRQLLDGMGNVILDNTCTRCHSLVDSGAMPMVPAAQLDLTDGPSADQPDHFKSYRELFFNDNKQVLDVGGNVIDELVQEVDENGVPVFLTDANGDTILDANNNPIPVMVPINVSPSLNVGGANFSPRFFDLFSAAGSHAGRLSDAELKLMSSMRTSSGQYYNDPFAVPQ